tara:strand:- start:2 stop:565 length:564 start_codon:yes stop_codon:yes gene_type:complete
MGIPTLIKTQTASNSTSLDFVDGTSDVVFDSTYDEYMFVFTDIGPATDGIHFEFQVNATDDAGGGYDTSLITSSYLSAYHRENDEANPNVAYQTSFDLAQAADEQVLADNIGNGSDESCAGILHLFNPSSTTYVKHFYSRFQYGDLDDYSKDGFSAGFINDTTAIDEIRFKCSSGNFDGVIQMYGIA